MNETRPTWRSRRHVTDSQRPVPDSICEDCAFPYPGFETFCPVCGSTNVLPILLPDGAPDRNAADHPTLKAYLDSPTGRLVIR